MKAIVVAERPGMAFIVTEATRLTKRQKAAIDQGVLLPLEIVTRVGGNRRKWRIHVDTVIAREFPDSTGSQIAMCLKGMAMQLESDAAAAIRAQEQ